MKKVTFAKKKNWIRLLFDQQSASAHKTVNVTINPFQAHRESSFQSCTRFFPKLLFLIHIQLFKQPNDKSSRPIKKESESIYIRIMIQMAWSMKKN